MDREEYEKDLKEKRAEHLKNINKRKNPYWSPCLHNDCTLCYGTGKKADGSMCIHFISCPCPKCTIMCMAV